MKTNKENIVRFLRGNSAEPIQFREIMGYFGVTKAGRTKLKTLMDKLVDDGELFAMKGNRYIISVDKVAIAGKLSTHRDGYGFVTPDKGDEDIFVPARFLRENMHGDRVEVRISSNKRD